MYSFERAQAHAFRYLNQQVVRGDMNACIDAISYVYAQPPSKADAGTKRRENSGHFSKVRTDHFRDAGVVSLCLKLPYYLANAIRNGPPISTNIHIADA